jgi:hypothetical protein
MRFIGPPSSELQFEVVYCISHTEEDGSNGNTSDVYFVMLGSNLGWHT